MLPFFPPCFLKSQHYKSIIYIQNSPILRVQFDEFGKCIYHISTTTIKMEYFQYPKGFPYAISRLISTPHLTPGNHLPAFHLYKSDWSFLEYHIVSIPLWLLLTQNIKFYDSSILLYQKFLKC